LHHAPNIHVNWYLAPTTCDRRDRSRRVRTDPGEAFQLIVRGRDPSSCVRRFRRAM
jgi:hypothetical protein